MRDGRNPRGICSSGRVRRAGCAGSLRRDGGAPARCNASCADGAPPRRVVRRTRAARDGRMRRVRIRKRVEKKAIADRIAVCSR
jgi:hypothetical protein